MRVPPIDAVRRRPDRDICCCGSRRSAAPRSSFPTRAILWSVPREGGEAKRLTAAPGVETMAVFSPDGSTIAFTGEYDGNVDVFVMPAAGGVPRRLTFHPGRT